MERKLESGNIWGNQTMWLSETYKDGKKFGEYIRFHINGVPWKKGRYLNNKKMVSGIFFLLMVKN